MVMIYPWFVHFHPDLNPISGHANNKTVLPFWPVISLIFLTDKNEIRGLSRSKLTSLFHLDFRNELKKHFQSYLIIFIWSLNVFTSDSKIRVWPLTAAFLNRRDLETFLPGLEVFFKTSNFTNFSLENSFNCLIRSLEKAIEH